jgi:hypothetical protein
LVVDDQKAREKGAEYVRGTMLSGYAKEFGDVALKYSGRNLSPRQSWNLTLGGCLRKCAGRRKRAIAPHGDVALLEHNPAGLGPYAHNFLQCPNLWMKGECDSFLNRSGA